jgi:hypothetical protein
MKTTSFLPRVMPRRGMATGSVVTQARRPKTLFDGGPSANTMVQKVNEIGNDVGTGVEVQDSKTAIPRHARRHRRAGRAWRRRGSRGLRGLDTSSISARGCSDACTASRKPQPSAAESPGFATTPVGLLDDRSHSSPISSVLVLLPPNCTDLRAPATTDGAGGWAVIGSRSPRCGRWRRCQPGPVRPVWRARRGCW